MYKLYSGQIKSFLSASPTGKNEPDVRVSDSRCSIMDMARYLPEQDRNTLIRIVKGTRISHTPTVSATSDDDDDSSSCGELNTSLSI
ncbi:hypothetical protein Ciccas_011147 [Cichlidogyrus casuarinus]|uniref:Uncharacterized protein n=1 Tax=Cichlidogyrus casuarinus TaxID=1844966 RepID=A0ABD2PS40_9PLAT